MKAISVSFENNVYIQGLNFIAAVLLLYCDDETTFWILFYMLKECESCELFTNFDIDIHRKFFIMNSLIKKYLPKLDKKLKNENIDL